MKQATLAATFSLLLALLLAVQGLAHHDQLVAGAGPSTKVAELFFEQFSKNPACKDYTFSVMASSVKHEGGILSSDKYLFGRTGRPLNEQEKARGKEEILLGRVPIAIAAGLESEAKTLTVKQLEQIFTRKITAWKEVGRSGAPIMLVGREENEALFTELKRVYPFFKTVKFDKIFKRDDEVVKFLNSPEGSHAISFGAKPNFQLYNLLPVEGFKAGVDLGLVYDRSNRDHPVIKAAIAYANSPEWKSLLDKVQMVPVD